MFNMGEAFLSATKWLRRLSESAFHVPEAARGIDGNLYAGMAIKPVEFTDQLANLQTALRQCEVRQSVEPTT